MWDSGADRGFEPLPPHDTGAEESVLGSMLIDPMVTEVIEPILVGRDFYHPRNRDVYGVVIALYERGEPTDFIMVSAELKNRDLFDRIGGEEYLQRLMMSVPTSIHAEHYAGIIKRHSIKRQLISAAGRIAAIGYDTESDFDLDLANAEAELSQVATNRNDSAFFDLAPLLEEYVSGIELGGMNQALGAKKIPTGFYDLDNILGGGMYRSDLIILAARPSIGKTALALNIARNVSVRFGLGVAIVSLEMSRHQLIGRLLATESGVDMARIREGKLSHLDTQNIAHAYEDVVTAKIAVDDSSDLTIAQIRNRVRRLCADHMVDLVIVDYIQLLSGTGHTDNRVQEVSEISRKLKAMARDMDVPVLALSQLNRSVESRKPHIPMLSDLRESGSIEQDADVVLLMYREDAYDHDSERKGITDLYIAKHRNGPTGLVSMLFMDRTMRFVDLEHQAHW